MPSRAPSLPPDLPSSPGTLADECDRALERAREQLTVAVAARTDGEMLNRIDESIRVIEDAQGWAELLFNVHPNNAMRLEAGRCRTRLAAVSAELRHDPHLHARLSAIDPEPLDVEARRFRSKLMAELERNGVHLDRETRRTLGQLRAEMAHVGQVFHSQLASAPPRIRIGPDEQAGLPDTWVATQVTQPDGSLDVPMTPDRYRTIVGTADDRAVRERAHVSFTGRVADENGPVTRRLLRLRLQYAQLLGYPNWAEYCAAATMAGSAEAVREFLDEVARRLAAPVAEERSQFAAILPGVSEDDLQSWDTPYASQKLQARVGCSTRGRVDDGFTFELVRKRLFAFIEEHLNVRFVPTVDLDVWDESVRTYAVHLDGKPHGWFYLDMQAREAKPAPGVTFPLSTGSAKGDVPSVALCGSLDRAGSLWVDEVATFVHEMGHVLHHLLSCRSRWVLQNGTRVEFDAVEIPSMVFEGWAEKPEFLAMLSGRRDPETVRRFALLCEARRVGQNLLGHRQLLISAISLELHLADPAQLDLEELTNRVFEEYAPWPRSSGDCWYANLWHLVDYGPDYYTYLWSEAIARDLQTRLHRGGNLEPSGLRAFVEHLLSAGASASAAELVHRVLGRDWDLSAFGRPTVPDDSGNHSWVATPAAGARPA